MNKTAAIKMPGTIMQRAGVYWQRSFTDRRYRALLHAGFWVFLLFFSLRENLVVHIDFSQRFVNTFSGIVLSLFLFYPLVYGVIPLLQKKRWMLAIVLFAVYYIAAVVLRSYHISRLIDTYQSEGGWFAGQDFWQNLYRHQLQPYHLLTGFFSGLAGLVSIIIIPLAVKFIRYAYRSNLQQVQLEKENVQLELNFLKAQINPHLFFNSLNNLQSYIVHDEKERSVELLNRLADLLRFSLYECGSEFVTVGQETWLLRNYIAVESVRYDERSEISACIDEDVSLSYPLPALLLMPLVENAFKYGASLPETRIQIQLATKDDTLHFAISNTYDYDGVPHRGGIGLQNVRRRLHHYFPRRHRLDIAETKELFTVTLTIYPPDHALLNR